jgi:hypothetical protein
MLDFTLNEDGEKIVDSLSSEFRAVKDDSFSMWELRWKTSPTKEVPASLQGKFTSISEVQFAIKAYEKNKQKIADVKIAEQQSAPDVVEKPKAKKLFEEALAKK